MNINDWLQQHPDYQLQAQQLGNSVWKIHHLASDGDRRIKCADDAKARYFLQQESLWISRISGNALGRCYSLDNYHNSLCLVTDYVPGVKLSTLIRDGYFSSEQNVAYIGEQLFQAVEQLHHQGVVHGDIKPDNILMDEEDLHLIDFANASWIGANMSARPYRGYSEHFSHPQLISSSGQYREVFDWFSLVRVLEVIANADVSGPVSELSDGWFEQVLAESELSTTRIEMLKALMAN